MDKEEVEENVIDIDVIDIIDHNDVNVISEEIERTDPEYLGTGIEVSDNKALKTGNLIAQFFNLVSQFRNKEYWKLDEKETKSLNKVCPKILPNIISEHSGLVTCILNLLSIIIKRVKMERKDSFSSEISVPYDNNEKLETEELQALTGGRTS